MSDQDLKAHTVKMFQGTIANTYEPKKRSESYAKEACLRKDESKRYFRDWEMAEYYMVYKQQA